MPSCRNCSGICRELFLSVSCQRTDRMINYRKRCSFYTSHQWLIFCACQGNKFLSYCNKYGNKSRMVQLQNQYCRTPFADRWMNREFQKRWRKRQRQINDWLPCWTRKNNRAVRAARTLTWSVKWPRKISKFKVLTTTWTHSSKSFILYIYFNSASTSTFAACFVNNKGCEEEALITKWSPFLKCLFSSDVLVAVCCRSCLT